MTSGTEMLSIFLTFVTISNVINSSYTSQTFANTKSQAPICHAVKVHIKNFSMKTDIFAAVVPEGFFLIIFAISKPDSTAHICYQDKNIK